MGQNIEEFQKRLEKTHSRYNKFAEAIEKSPAVKIGKIMRKHYKNHLEEILVEQEEAEDKWINRGYAYFSNFHLVTLYGGQNFDKFLDKIDENGIIDFTEYRYFKADNSQYVKEVFASTNKDNLAHIIPLLTLLIERLMRILTDKLDSEDAQGQIKGMISRSIIKYEMEGTEEKDELEKEEGETSLLEKKIAENVRKLYTKTYENIIMADFLKRDSKAKGNILNRHTLFHGKKNLDELTKEDTIKLFFLMHFFIDLIKLKETGKFIIKGEHDK